MIIKGLGGKSLCQAMSLSLPFITAKFLVQVFIMGKLHTKDFPPEWNLILEYLGKKQNGLTSKQKSLPSLYLCWILVRSSEGGGGNTCLEFSIFYIPFVLFFNDLETAGQKLCF